MSFSEFKNIAEVQALYKIKYEEGLFLSGAEQMPSVGFLEDFEFSKENIDIFTSESSRSEIIISPLLREMYKKHCEKYSFWIQKGISFDEVLTGTPDYMFSKKSSLGKTVLEVPLVIIVEAKKNDFEQGWGQCLAELVAAQKINKDTERPVYGVVTDGNLWQFGRLRRDVFTRNPENFTVDHLARLYGALEFLADLVEQDEIN
ncbi:Type I site-specific deoxyribonuclease [Candidatus Electrothrix laxa]